jgi:hypothetical protein
MGTSLSSPGGRMGRARVRQETRREGKPRFRGPFKNELFRAELIKFLAVIKYLGPNIAAKRRSQPPAPRR